MPGHSFNGRTNHTILSPLPPRKDSVGLVGVLQWNIDLLGIWLQPIYQVIQAYRFSGDPELPAAGPGSVAAVLRLSHSM